LEFKAADQFVEVFSAHGLGLVSPQNLTTATLNQTAKDWHTRVVTLSEVKGLKDRFFATLRMTVPNEYIVKCTNVMHSGLAGYSHPFLNFLHPGLVNVIGPDHLGYRLMYVFATDQEGEQLQIVKTAAPDPVRPGEQLTYTLTVANQGATALTGVVLTDVVPVGAYRFGFSETLTEGGDCPGTSCEPGELIAWNLGTLAAGQSVTKHVQMPVHSSLSDGLLIVNNAQASYSGGEASALAKVASRVCEAGGIACDPPPPPLPLLSVSINGNGTVTSNPGGINCPGDCLESYGTGTVVTLTPNAANGWSFTGWSGNPDCTDGQVTMDVDKTCTAIFNLRPPQTFRLSVSITGNGTVASIQPGIICPNDCVRDYSAGTLVTLTPTPSSGWSFASWSGSPDCSDGQVTMDADRNCLATFNPPPGPDLTGAWLSNSQLCRTVGGIQRCTVKGKFKEENIGELPAGRSKTQLFLSGDPVYNPGDQLLKIGAVPVLRPGRTKTIFLSRALDPGVNVAGKYLIACVDFTEAVAERDEMNNCAAAGPVP
jgi:uncharacterized repeat protein (TIGR01451 family)